MEVEGDHLVKEGNSQSGTKEGLARPRSISRTTLPTLDFRQVNFGFVVLRIYFVCISTQVRIICPSRINTKLLAYFLL